MHRPRAWKAALALLALVGATVAGPARATARGAEAAAVPAAPVIGWAQAGTATSDPAAGSQYAGSVAGPAGASAVFHAWTSAAETCDQATEGPGVVALPTETLTLGPGTTYFEFYQPLIAGSFVYATVTIDGETSPVSACFQVRPGRPSHITLTDVSPTSASFTWEPAQGATEYELSLATRHGSGPTVLTGSADPQGTVTGLAPAGVYLADVAALHDALEAPASRYGRYVVPPFGTEVDVARRQYPDFFGHAPKGDAEVWSFNRGYQAGKTTSTLIDAMVDNPYWGKVQGPMVRLMTAYFQREPDHGGLTYWANQLRKGRSLRAVSSVLAGSPEFEHKYGKLTNAQFVDRVYRNVLGRAPDPTGLHYWTRKLDAKATSRGGMMASFSESGENVRKTKAYVDTIDVITAMLRRMPTTAELAQWAPKTGTPPARTSLIFSVIGSSEYDARLPAPAGPA
jgi:hypothetical protein